MQNLQRSIGRMILGSCVLMPLAIGTVAAYAGSGGGPGGGNPACLVSGPTVTACSKVDDDSNCPDDHIEDGDCPSINFSTAGLTGPPHNFQVDCKYYRNNYDTVNGGCNMETTLRTYHASCQEPDGTSCPAP